MQRPSHLRLIHWYCEGHHVDLFSDCRQLVEEKSTLLSVSLEYDYVLLYKTLKGRYYADFQIKHQTCCWIQVCFGHNGCSSSWSRWYLSSLESFGKWISGAHSTEDLGVDSNYIMLHQITKQVYNSQQMQVLESKQCQASAHISDHDTPLPTQSSGDSLFRMCGAEIGRMIRVKT